MDNGVCYNVVRVVVGQLTVTTKTTARLRTQILHC